MKRHLLACLVILATTAPAFAQEPSPRRNFPERRGLLVGFSVGGGHIEADCDDCGTVLEAGGAHFQLGGMLGPRLALMGDAWAMAHTEDNVTISHAVVTCAAQIWLANILWLKGGLGVARASYQWDGPFVTFRDESKLAPAIMFGVGVEFLRSRRFAMDAQLRVGTGFYDTDDSEENGYEVRATNVQLGVGFTWY